MKLYTKLFVLALALLLSSCASKQFAYQSDSPYISCKLQVLIAGETTQKIDGVVQLYKDSLLQISFRAPVVKSELAFLLYTPTDILVIDRINKVFGTSSYPVDLVEGITVFSFDEIQQKIISAAKSTNKRNYYLASKFGWDILGEATVELYKFNSEPFNIRSSKVSRKYVEHSLRDMLQALDLK